MCKVLWLQNNHASLRSQLTVLPAFLPHPRWPTWSPLSALDFHPSCLYSLLIVPVLCSLLFCEIFSVCLYDSLSSLPPHLLLSPKLRPGHSERDCWSCFKTDRWPPQSRIMLLGPPFTHCDECFQDSSDLLFPSWWHPLYSVDFYYILIRTYGLPVCILNEWCFSCGIFRKEGFLMGFELLKIEHDSSQEKYNDTWGLSAGIT